MQAYKCFLFCFFSLPHFVTQYFIMGLVLFFFEEMLGNQWCDKSIRAGLKWQCIDALFPELRRRMVSADRALSDMQECTAS